MISNILKAKHWQVFLILFGPVFCFQLFAMQSIFNIRLESETDILAPLQLYFSYAPVLILLTIFTMGTWFWSIGVGLQKTIPSELQLKVNRFKIALLIPGIYSLFFIWGFIYIINNIFAASGDIAPALILDWFPYIIPLHLLSIFCIFYCMAFVAKTIQTAESQRTVSFGDYIGNFFLIWFLPIGVWILQPKINELIAIDPVPFAEQESSSTLLDDDFI